MPDLDDEFYTRADAHIHLSNRQITSEVTRGKVSASMLYATARFNAWISACGWQGKDEMAAAKTDTLEYFVQEYRKMLEENLDEYINNFDIYMKRRAKHDKSNT